MDTTVLRSSVSTHLSVENARKNGHADFDGGTVYYAETEREWFILSLTEPGLVGISAQAASAIVRNLESRTDRSVPLSGDCVVPADIYDFAQYAPTRQPGTHWLRGWAIYSVIVIQARPGQAVRYAFRSDRSPFGPEWYPTGDGAAGLYRATQLIQEHGGDIREYVSIAGPDVEAPY